jgi:hypothetical protein
MLRLFLLSIVLQLLTACSTVLIEPDMDSVKDLPLAYQQGYKEGCKSGYVAGGSLVHSFKRDTDRAQNDEQYRLGWKDAYRRCKADFRELCKSDAIISKADLYCSDVWQQGLDKEE